MKKLVVILLCMASFIPGSSFSQDLAPYSAFLKQLIDAIPAAGPNGLNPMIYYADKESEKREDFKLVKERDGQYVFVYWRYGGHRSIFKMVYLVPTPDKKNLQVAKDEMSQQNAVLWDMALVLHIDKWSALR